MEDILCGNLIHHTQNPACCKKERARIGHRASEAEITEWDRFV